jgi:hypothetical protein
LSIKVFWSIVSSFIGLLMSGGALVLGIVGLLHGWITFDPGTNLVFPLLLLGFIGLLFLAIFLACLLYLAVGAGNRYAAIRHEPVQNITGNLQTREERGDESPSIYYYDIGQLSFQVSSAAYKALISGMLYRVYYLASSKTLASVEALEAPVR